jgi:sugar (pentulose or hexulose) kinase
VDKGGSVVDAVAVFDVGKSNAKLALVDLPALQVMAIRTTANPVSRDGPYPHVDVDRLWRWLLDGLAEFAAKAHVSTIATTTHGACFALTAGDALALPILDYEFAGPDAVADAYRKIRGPFAETLSPDLPGGLNAGRQLFWLRQLFPGAFAACDALLPYPQYWSWRLSGAKTAEVTLFGAHTDLWNPRAATFSRLAEAEGWARLVPPLARPWDTAGMVRADIVRGTGLPADCRVVAGIHDSNASLLPHLLSRPLPFAVISTGTWMITFAAGGSLGRLDESRGCLANVDAFARPVPSAMCMAGREFERVAGIASAVPTAADVARVVKERIMALPAFVPQSGPFGRRRGSWSTDPAALPPGVRTAAASLYCALLGATCLGLTGADGPTIVEGPFARNSVFLGALARLAPRPVLACPDATGTTGGAAILALGPGAAPPSRAVLRPVEPIALELSAYAREWEERAAT